MFRKKSKLSAWNDVLGPFYSDTALLRRGIEVSDDLISLTTVEGTALYPHAQFDVLSDSALQRREKVLELWNKLVRPAIIEGVVDEWTATGLLLQATEGQPSIADTITKDPTQVERVATEIARSISRFRQ